MTWDAITGLDALTVDRYLANLGITMPGPTLSFKRKCELLWQAMHAPTGKLENNQILSKLIRENPYMPYEGMRAKFKEFTHISRRKFFDLRKALRYRGYNIPKAHELRKRRFNA